MDTVELLAPAKDLQCGQAAIDCGADAVYIGAARFGAREAAGNSLEDITALAQYAHRCWARVYATVNTLLRDGELPEALELIQELYAAGIDGLIIQDVGLLECDLPPLPLIASTQMDNSTPEKVRFLESAGFKRAILARELDLDQIRAIRQKTSLELECFVHGALCVGASGQCALSYALGGRSGNRGQCAQPCRKLYTLTDADGKPVAPAQHWLSLHDLNLTEQVGELLDAEVRAFKIEGRLKDRPYVMNVVAHWRQTLDAALEGRQLRRRSSGVSQPGFTPDVSKTFNRGYTSYFLHGFQQKVGRPETTTMVGEFVGNVSRTGPDGFDLDRDFPLHPADGICFFAEGKLQGTLVNVANGRHISPARMEGIRKETAIYRNHDHQFITLLDHAKPSRTIGVRLRVSALPDGLALQAEDEDGCSVRVELAGRPEPARDPEKAAAALQTQLARMGGSGFHCQGVEMDMPETPFLPMSAINDLRRKTLDALREAREAARPVESGGPVRNGEPYPEKNLTFLGNVLNKRAEAFYTRHGVQRVEPAAESGLDLIRRTVMTTRYCIRRQLGMCPRYDGYPGAAEPLWLTDEFGNRLKVRFECARCGMAIMLQSRGSSRAQPL